MFFCVWKMNNEKLFESFNPTILFTYTTMLSGFIFSVVCSP